MLCGQYGQTALGGAVYAKARNLVPRVRAAYDDALERYDMLVMPTVPGTAETLPAGGGHDLALLANAHGKAINTAPMDITGHPAISVPAGLLDGLTIPRRCAGGNVRHQLQRPRRSRRAAVERPGPSGGIRRRQERRPGRDHRLAPAQSCPHCAGSSSAGGQAATTSDIAGRPRWTRACGPSRRSSHSRSGVWVMRKANPARQVRSFDSGGHLERLDVAKLDR